MRERNKIRVKTKYLKKDILFKADYPSDPEERAIYKYNCPICLQYFNHILVSTCCSNYICRICIGKITNKSKSDHKYIIHCTYCGIYDFRLSDVKDNDTLKFYSDSPRKNEEP